MRATPMNIEVLICTHNRVDLLQTVIQSLNDVSKPDNCNVSIRVIANACDDQTHHFLEEYQKLQTSNNKISLMWHKEPTPGKSFALNMAISKLEGDLIAFVDDDHRIDKKYFLSLSHAYKAYQKATIFFGKILPDWTGDEPGWARDTGEYAIYPLPVPHYDKGNESFEYDNTVAIPGGGNLALKREVFERVGFFNTELGPQRHNLGGGEDGDYVLRAIKGGEKLRYLPDMIQYHYVDLERFNLSYILLKSFQRSRSVITIRNDNVKKIPLYLWRKLLTYFFKVIFSWSIRRSRFFLVRCAAVLGEMSGFLKVIKLNNSNTGHN